MQQLRLRALSQLSLCQVLFFCVIGSAQQTAAPVTFTSKANLVIVPVVIDDGSGKHVWGLTKDDFAIFENGKSQPIASFEDVQTKPRPIERAPRQPGVYTNMLAGEDVPKRLTIFALDTVNTPFLDQAYARQELVKFLANRMDSKEPCALISIQPNGIRILHDFTSDPALLVAALKKATGQLPGLTFTRQELEDTKSRELVNVGDPKSLQNQNGGDPYGPSRQEFETQAAEIDSFVKGTDINYAMYAQKNNILTTLEAFQHVAEAYAGVPGRKSLVWVTAAFPFGLDPTTGTLLAPRVFQQGQAVTLNTMDSTGGLPELPSSNRMSANQDLKPLAPIYERTIQMLNDAEFSLYPVDARGLMTFFPDATTTRIEGLQSFNSALFESSRETMNGFAEMTGGKAFYNRNDLDVAFAKAADDSDSYYLLGYYLDKNAKPGWHKLQVKLKGHRGHVRARNGFFVTPPGRQSDARKLDIRLALASPLNYTGLPLSVRWLDTLPAGDKKKVNFELLLSKDSGVVDEANNNHLDFDVVAAVRKPDGQNADQLWEHIESNLKPDTMSTFRKDGLNYSKSVEVPNGEYVVRFVVRDNLSGRMGSISAPLKTTP